MARNSGFLGKIISTILIAVLPIPFFYSLRNTPDMNNSTRNPVKPLSNAIRIGLASARENTLPGVLLWIIAVFIITGYYFLPPVTAALTTLGNFKEAAGYRYSAVATAIFGGLIPFLWRLLKSRRMKKLNPAHPSPWKVPAWKAGLFLLVFWAWKGVEIDFLYRMQTVLFGSGSSARVLVPKVLVDQFLYNPLWAGGMQILAYWWLENAFSKAALIAPSLWKSIGPRLVTVLISTWGVWIPMVSIIYAMPANLQVPLFNIALCFWGLMLASLTREK
jgi:hypothetical protein